MAIKTSDKKQTKSFGAYLFALVALGLLWVWYFTFRTTDWPAIALGFVTGVIFVSIVMDFVYDLPPFRSGSRAGDDR